MEFRIRDDIQIRSRSFRTDIMTDYTSEDTTRIVSYFLSKINSIDDQNKPIGVMFGKISFISVCCMLALIKSGKDYAVIYYKGDDFRSDADHFCSHVFALGPFDVPEKVKSVISVNPSFYTESTEVEALALAHNIECDLTFTFNEKRKTYCVLADTEELQISSNTGKIEESSTKTAMDNYFYEDDYCLFNRPLRHTGVATLCVYPALFKAKGISFCENKGSWKIEIETVKSVNFHVHMGFEMFKENWALPESLRMLTGGGYNFSNDLIGYVLNNSNVRNIIDCFGTADCPPPLAIRKLYESKDPIPFTWVNKYINLVNQKDLMYLSTQDPDMFKGFKYESNGLLAINDRIQNIDDETFYLTGTSNDRLIRMNHRLWPWQDFITYLNKNSDIKSAKLAFYNENKIEIPVIVVNKEDLEKTLLFVSENHVEATIYIKHD